ncbi:MAG: sugar phosphate isomerase/epimerase family protein [Labedaea sp.]
MIDLVLATAEIDEDETLAPLVDSAVELGVRWVDLLYPRNTDFEGLQRTLNRLADADLRVAAIGTRTELGIEGDVKQHQQRLMEAISVAVDVGCEYVNTYCGARTRMDDGVVIKEYQRNLEPCLELAQRRNVTITLENEFDALGQDPHGSDLTRRADAVRKLVESVGSDRFRLAFDPCNAHFADAECFPAYYETIREFIGYVHVKDGHLRSDPPDSRWKCYDDHGRGYQVCELGSGALNWHGILSGLLADGYDGFLCLEPHALPGHRAEAWRQAVRFLQPLTSATGGQ